MDIAPDNPPMGLSGGAETFVIRHETTITADYGGAGAPRPVRSAPGVPTTPACPTHWKVPVVSPKRTQKLELLRSVKLFRLCKDKELEDIAKLADEATMPAGAVLTTEGTPGRECFIIASGRASVTLRGASLGEVGPGDAVGEMALLDSSPRSATVTALTDMDVFVLEPRSFGELLERHPSVAKLMLAELARRLREVEHAPTAY